MMKLRKKKLIRKRSKKKLKSTKLTTQTRGSSHESKVTS
jgi:hypothetical protein